MMLKIKIIKIFTILLTIVVLSSIGWAQDDETETKTDTKTAAPKPAEGPKPDFLVKYGDSAANVFDFWKPKSDKPTPLVVYIHGGSLSSGTREKISLKQVQKFLDNGIAVMSVDYRLTPEAVYPQHYLDCARAIQFARYKAKELNINPKKVAAYGSSAGGLTALWIGFHDDLADPKSDDPVLRESSRLVAVAGFSAQTTVEPEVVKAKVGEAALGHSYFKGKFLGLKTKELDTPKAAELFKAASPTTYLTKGDPPVWLMYTVPKTPLTADSSYSDGIHHIAFGYLLKEQMDKLKIKATVVHKDDLSSVNGALLEFFQKYLK